MGFHRAVRHVQVLGDLPQRLTGFDVGVYFLFACGQVVGIDPCAVVGCGRITDRPFRDLKRNNNMRPGGLPKKSEMCGRPIAPAALACLPVVKTCYG